jgi:hypothetical protein
MAYTTINKGSSYFNTVLYTGNGVGGTNITGVGFQPDLVWIKRRSATEFHVWNDAVRGVPKNIYSNSTSAEDTGSLMSAIISDGFTVQTDGSVNGSGSTYVAWNWLANNTSGSSNTAGTITSTVAANTTAGFSIVRYTGTGANATVGHGLGVAPRMMIIKDRTSGAYNWTVYHASIGNTRRIILNSNAGQDSADSRWWNNTSPTSTVFTIGIDNGANASGDSFIAYCFAEIKGYSKFGSYAGNNALDGTFVYTGFSPSFVLVKRYGGGAQNWVIYDDKRNTYNVTNSTLRPNTTAAEATNNAVDLLSNGFKFRSNDGDSNGYSDGYIYMAFAENPFVTSGGIPTTAR